MTLRLLLLLLGTQFLCLPSAAKVVMGSQGIVLPSGGDDLVVFSPDEPPELRVRNVVASADWTTTKEGPVAQCYRVVIDKRVTAPKNVQASVALAGEANAGDAILVSFWARRPKAGGQPSELSIAIGDGESAPELEYRTAGYRKWTQHVRSFVATKEFDSAKTSVTFDLGKAGKIVEIADLRIVNYGSDRDITTLPRSRVTYDGQDPDAAWRKVALDRIQRQRKADMLVTVVDSGGQPVPGARVHVAMQRHAFGFGCAVNSELLGAVEAEFPLKHKRGAELTWEDARRYRQTVSRYFNQATFESALRPAVWHLMQSDSPEGSRRRTTLIEGSLPWLRRHDIVARGHYLGWAPMDFNAIEKPFVGNPKAHRKWLWGHMADILGETGETVGEWDTINHIVGWGKHTYEQEYQSPQVYADILAEARRLAPHAVHTINEGKVLPDGYKREPYLRVIRELNERGQAPDSVGFMAHFGLTTLTPPEELLDVYGAFAKVAPRLQLTELDVDVGDDEELQADYLRDVLIASFSHPSFVAINQWGFWESAHWKPQAALWRSDWTLKPAGKVFTDLVCRQWWTDESLVTDHRGECRLRGFLGTYYVTVEHGGLQSTAEVSLCTEGGHFTQSLPTAAQDAAAQDAAAQDIAPGEPANQSNRKRLGRRSK